MENGILDNHQHEQTLQLQSSLNAYMTRVFGWMALALSVTAVTSLFVASSVELIQFIFGNRIVFYSLLGGELLLVWGISGAINRISPLVATALFLLYSVLNGATLALILLVYTGASIGSTFFITAGTFGVMAVAGYFTKTDLTSMGRILIMGLVGLILASVANWFLNSDTIYWICTYAGVLIFTGLVGYDAQKIKNMGIEAITTGQDTNKLAILGALILYLDFINLFLFLLRLFGRRR